MKPRLLGSPQAALRFLVIVGIYACALICCLRLAYLLRFDFEPDQEYLRHFALIATWLIAAKLICLGICGQFESLLTYFGINDARRIFLACLAASLLALVIWFRVGIDYAPPRAVILTDLLLSFVSLCSIRMSFRLARQGYFSGGKNEGNLRRVAIIGAGDVGSSLVRDMQLRRGLRRKALVFFDDDQSKWGTTIHGVPVIGRPETLGEATQNLGLEEIIIAMPNAPTKRLREIVQLLGKTRLPFAIVPSYEQLMTSRTSVSQLRPVEIDDLLGRQAIDLRTQEISNLVGGRVVMVTGAGGSIGSELCRQIITYNPARLLLVERCEALLFQIEQQLISAGSGAEILPLVADFTDVPRMRGIFSRIPPSLVFHAAAHKHVPLMEHQAAEAVMNNAYGTRGLALLAEEFGVTCFVLISTDKAVNPSNVMGATKRMAELYLQALQKPGAGTKFMAVRFGNVLGSSGSVIPTFKQQIAAGGPITITHPQVSRYFMTAQEAAGLVLQSATQGAGGEIFVLDMGKPMKIVDLARQLIELSGLRPEIDIEIKYIGLRPGEKLHEELIHDEENIQATSHPKIMRFVGKAPVHAEIEARLVDLHRRISALDPDQVKSEIQRIVPEYKPYVPGV